MAAKKTIRSMTGYGEARGDHEGAEILTEIWSLNHRYLDFSFHGPEGLASWEIPLKKLVGERVARGRVRLSVKFAGGKDPSHALVLSEARAQEYMEFYRDLRAKYNLKGALSAEQLLLAPHVVVPAGDVPDREAVLAAVTKLVSEALERLEEMQRVEGAALKTDLMGRFNHLGALVGRIREQVPMMVEAHRTALETRLKNTRLETPVPPERLAQELTLFADRCDVTEELVRLESHLSQCRTALEKGGEVGHRLDFLSQELNREINTTGSKSQSAEVAAMVVEFKEELSKVKEQLQNLV
jgi:uncharacterized protein (TIGR00255 family)